MPLPAPAARASVAPTWGEELTTAERHELWEERAAIMEYDGGLRREFAEEEARRDVTRNGGRQWPDGK